MLGVPSVHAVLYGVVYTGVSIGLVCSTANDIYSYIIISQSILYRLFSALASDALDLPVGYHQGVPLHVSSCYIPGLSASSFYYDVFGRYNSFVSHWCH